jgi:hypothetical protein
MIFPLMAACCVGNLLCGVTGSSQRDDVKDAVLRFLIGAMRLKGASMERCADPINMLVRPCQRDAVMRKGVVEADFTS